MDALEEEAKKEIADAEEALLVAQHSDPSDILTTEELERANAKRSFVSDEVYTLGPDELLKRCRAVLAQGDRPAMFVHAHFADQIVDDINDLEKREEMREVVSALRTKLDPAGEKKSEAAREALEEAPELENYVYYRRRGVKDAYGLYVKQTYAAR